MLPANIFAVLGLNPGNEGSKVAQFHETHCPSYKFFESRCKAGGSRTTEERDDGFSLMTLYFANLDINFSDIQAGGGNIVRKFFSRGWSESWIPKFQRF